MAIIVTSFSTSKLRKCKLSDRSSLFFRISPRQILWCIYSKLNIDLLFATNFYYLCLANVYLSIVFYASFCYIFKTVETQIFISYWECFSPRGYGRRYNDCHIYTMSRRKYSAVDRYLFRMSSPIAISGVLGFIILVKNNQLLWKGTQVLFIGKHFQSSLAPVFFGRLAGKSAKYLPIKLLERIFSLVLLAVIASLFFGQQEFKNEEVDLYSVWFYL